MGRPKGSKNEKADNLEAFARRVEREILKASLKGQETIERLICRILVSHQKNPAVAATMAGKWVEWRYGKATEKLELSGVIDFRQVVARARQRMNASSES